MTTWAGESASVSGGGCCPFACLFGRMVQALATILLRTGHKPGAARRVDIKQRNALNRRGHPPD
jgi:hypothetical protein